MSRHRHDEAVFAVEGGADAHLLPAQSPHGNFVASFARIAGQFEATLHVISLEALGHEGLIHLDEAVHGVSLNGGQRVQYFMPHVKRSLQADAHDFCGRLQSSPLDHALDVCPPYPGLQFGEHEHGTMVGTEAPSTVPAHETLRAPNAAVLHAVEGTAMGADQPTGEVLGHVGAHVALTRRNGVHDSKRA